MQRTIRMMIEGSWTEDRDRRDREYKSVRSDDKQWLKTLLALLRAKNDSK